LNVATGAKIIITLVELLDGQIPFVVNVTVYVFIVLALTSIRPVEVFRNTRPGGVDEKVPVVPPVIFAGWSVPV
jgi:hypothetical protein